MSTARSIRGPRLFPVVLSVLLLLALAGPALATWSIVVSNTETGEVAIGSATCLEAFDLMKNAGVIVVGKGAGQSQALVDTSGLTRTIMVDGLKVGKTAQEIMDDLEANDPLFESHQFGIVDISGGAASHTGNFNGAHASGVTGQSGPMVYAIQGNVLTGAGVVFAAEQALVQTPGDLGQKLMAAMEAAKKYGGDGRCSCAFGQPTICGCPPVNPPNDKKKIDNFMKSAHVGYMVIARIGDTDGEFNVGKGFANGSYYMNLNLTNTPSHIDPVDRLAKKFSKFRKDLADKPDHILSQKVICPESILADGKSRATLMIALVDINNERIHHGGASITVTHDGQSSGAAIIGDVMDHNDGTYTVPLIATTTPGIDVFRIVVEDKLAPASHGPVTLYPFPTLESAAPTLLVDKDKVSVSQGTAIEFSLMGSDLLAGRNYIMLGSSSGTTPGFDTGGVHIPLNPDLFSRRIWQWLWTPIFRDGMGTLNRDGQAKAVLHPVRDDLLPLVGGHLSFAWTTLTPLDYASTPVTVAVKP